MTSRIGVLLVVCACAASSTSIEQGWRAPAATRPRNVVTFYNSSDGSVRRNIEDKLAYKLRRLGVAATPSYAVVDPTVAIGAMRPTLQAAGYDGIVAMRSIGDGAAFPTTTDTNYVYTDVVVRIETAVYSVSDGKMLWSALSRTVDPERASRVIDEVTTLVARDLGRQGVFVATLH